MEIKRLRPSGTLRKELFKSLGLGDGLGLRQNASGLPELSSGAWVELRAEGLKVDGSTDDTTEMDQVLDYMDGLGGGVVLHRVGTLYIDEARLRSNTLLVGSREEASIIKQRPNAHTTFTTGTSSGSNTASTVNDTSKAWTPHALTRSTIRILTGTGAGQKALIYDNTATQVTLNGSWRGGGTTPDATSTYDILAPKHLISLDATTVEWAGVANLTLDGNKANQLAILDGIHFSQDLSTIDEHHLFQNLQITSCSGSGWTAGRNVRLSTIHNVRVESCDEHGFDNSIAQDTPVGGASDAKFIACTAAENGLSGFMCNFYGSAYVACKAFGNGDREVSGNGAGFLINGLDLYFSSCESQENWEHGYSVYSSTGISLNACVADSNQGSGIRIDDVQDSYIQVIVSDTPGLLYEHDIGLAVADFFGDCDRNEIHVQAGVGIGGIDTPSNLGGDDWAFVNNRLFGRWATQRGVAGSTSDEHIVWGKEEMGATDNPYYALKTENSSTPKGLLLGYDGTTALTFLTFDYENAKLVLGDSGSVAVEVSGALTVATLGIAGGVPASVFVLTVGDGAADERSLFASSNAFAVGVQQGAGNGRAYIGATASATPSLVFSNNAGTTLGSMTNAGALTWLGDLSVAATKKIYPDGGGDTYIYESVANIIDFFAGGALALRVDYNAGSPYIQSTGGLIIAATKTLWLDGGGDTYITEASANLVRFVAGGLNVVDIGTTFLYPTDDNDTTLGGSSNRWQIVYSYAADFKGVVASVVGTDASSTDDHFRFGKVGSGTSGNPYYAWKTDNSAQAVAIFIGYNGTTTHTFLKADYANAKIILGDSEPVAVEIANNISVAGDVVVAATSKVRLDGSTSGDTYISESSANRVQIIAGGSSALSCSSADLTIAGTVKFYLDGGSNTYIYESAADTVSIIAGGGGSGAFDSSTTAGHLRLVLYDNAGSPKRLRYAADGALPGAGTKIVYIDT